ncbi:putative peptidase M36 family protein [Lyophyllum shimeji]|uniref:Extracellular metalloproteinase n=1 Tax=Lyophyllum shimeji TaxID=47721 RepID=A0A9P3PZJ0_LYOSH|nr:putative peptidase M36 family protein [Lyophyllum shimeji]
MMVLSNKFLTSAYLVVLYASTAGASSKQSTHCTRNVGRSGFKVEVFHPQNKFETFGMGLEPPDSFGPLSLSDATVAFVKSRLGVDASKVAFNSGFGAETAEVAYVKQAHDGIPFANAVANVAWKNNKVVSFGSSFVKSDKIASSTPSISVQSIISTVEQALDGKYNGHPATLEYLARPDGTAALTHVFQIQNEESGSWYEAFVDAHTGQILTVTDFVSDATYKVLPITKETLPEGQEILVDPQDLFASPLGWHDDGTTKTNNTSGNNVIAFKGMQSNVTFQSAEPLIFNYTYDDTIAPTEDTNIDAARSNAFYIINSVHDLAYRYGFTEAGFNFQTDNFGKGGVGNDRVLMSVQDSSGTNNANFATPADGQSGRCRMYIWTRTPVRRDGSLENDIIRGAWARAGQMRWLIDYVLGQYVINSAGGIRTFPYSTNATTNPLRYSSIADLDEVHDIGEVWANMLHNVYAALVAEHGWSSTARANPEGTEGNIVFLHLFIDALTLQPCNPTFVSARDAWIQADANRYGGTNACTLWKAFASRGLGVDARNFVDSSTVPPACI